jgi:hypothetical protein
MINCQQKVKEGELGTPATVFQKETIENPEGMAVPRTHMTCNDCCRNCVFYCLIHRVTIIALLRWFFPIF